MFVRLVRSVLMAGTVAWAGSGLTYSTYLREGFTPAAIATDAAGNVLVAGATGSAATVVKLNASGGAYVFARTFGGSATDAATGIAIDGSGDAYVTGTTSSPDFPLLAGGQTGTLPTRADDTRAFLVEFNPQGEMVFSEALGSVTTTGLAIALAADGGVVVSGISGAGLAASAGAYSVAQTYERPFLMKVKADGSSVVFTATGIGGSSLAVDAAGNIYMAGSTTFTDYPTTPGAYQSTINPVYVCYFPCQISFPATNQYATKVDAGATKLIYSTGVAGQSATVNRGLAVDAAGNAYVTGVAEGVYNWTIGQADAQLLQPFLTKLDAAGANALYSTLIGGAGVAVGANGDVYVGGAYNDTSTGVFGGPTPLPALPLGVASLPQQCQVNSITTFSEAYVSRVDATTGNVLSTALADGANVSPAGIAFAGGYSVWLAGPTTQADTPITQGAVTPESLAAGVQPGAYVGEMNFNLNQTAGPRVACVLDGANEARAGVVAPSQILTLIGNGLGPATGVSAPGSSTTTLAGVDVTFDGTAAALLYVSQSQINVAVPADVLEGADGVQNFATMQVSVNGTAGMTREMPLTQNSPSLFADLSGAVTQCTIGTLTYYSSFNVFALNADGTVNSCSNPATVGSTVSLFVNGMGANGIAAPWLPSAIPVAVRIGYWSAEVTSVVAQTPFVWQMNVIVPEALATGAQSAANVAMDMDFTTGVTAVGPFAVAGTQGAEASAGMPIPVTLWVIP